MASGLKWMAVKVKQHVKQAGCDHPCECVEAPSLAEIRGEESAADC